jgi:hypothetical protein
MRTVAFWLLAGASLYAQTRYARLGDIEGGVETQIHPTEAWKTALCNTPLLEASSVRTGPASHAEIEFDDGGVLRLAENSLCELSDYTRLSTGQRITHISLDAGVAYFDGESSSRDALVLSLPNARVAIRRGSRVRLEAGLDVTRLAVLEGEARLTSAAIELEVPEGKMLKLELARSDKFYLLPEISKLDSDTWSLTRDKTLAADSSQNRLPGLRYGVRDLDLNGEWIDTEEFGVVWKPKVAQGWSPFHDGKWQWYDGLGYTWISAESWGWLPYHYGRWMLQPSQGWIWAAGARRVFRPGDVYWMRGAGFVGWGPLAPRESWSGVGTPALYLKTSTTFARYAPSPETREIDPGSLAGPPNDPLAVASFLETLPSPRIRPERLEYARDPDRPGLIRLSPGSTAADRWRTPEAERPVTQVQPPPPAMRAALPPPPVIVMPPATEPEPIVETYYIAPIYTGIIVMNPPEKKPPPKKKKQPPDELTSEPAH